jgi:hypothetical protein
VNRVDNLFQKNGLSRLGRRDNQLARALAYRCNEVYYAHALLAATAQVKTLVRIDRHQIGKAWACAKGLRHHTAKRLDGHQLRFAFLWLDLTGDGCPFDQSKAASQIRVNHHFGQSRTIGPVGGSNRKLQFANTF